MNNEYAMVEAQHLPQLFNNNCNLCYILNIAPTQISLLCTWSRRRNTSNSKPYADIPHNATNRSKYSLSTKPTPTRLTSHPFPYNTFHNYSTTTATHVTFLIQLLPKFHYYAQGVEEETLPIPNPTPIYPTTQLTNLNTHNQQNPHPLA